MRLIDHVPHCHFLSPGRCEQTQVDEPVSQWNGHSGGQPGWWGVACCFCVSFDKSLKDSASREDFLPSWLESRVLRPRLLNSKVHVYHKGVFFQCRFCVSGSGVRPETLHFNLTSTEWCLCYWFMAATFSSWLWRFLEIESYCTIVRLFIWKQT